MQNNKKIPDKKKYLLFTELHSLLTSGLSFSRAFDLLIQNEKKAGDKKRLEDLYEGIVRGDELWKSMEKSGCFAVLDYGVVRIGEQTGRLDKSLQFLSDYYSKKIVQRRMLASALSYPVIILVTAVLVLVFMITVIVPMFGQVYSRMGSELPAMTLVMVSISKKFPMVLAFLGLIVTGAVAVWVIFGKKEKFRERISVFLLGIPIAGNLIRKHYQSQFCKLLFLLVSANVPLLKSLDMLSAIIGFYPYEKSFRHISDGLKRGESFSGSMSRFPGIYERKLVTLMKVGEETGSLDKMLFRQAEDITSELEHDLKQLGSVLEPILILFMGTIVAFILIAMYMPMFKLGQAFG
jgi:type IV pilus assembly protein PilC